jgi:hypothetical protein
MFYLSMKEISSLNLFEGVGAVAPLRVPWLKKGGAWSFSSSPSFPSSVSFSSFLPVFSIPLVLRSKT